MTRKYTIDGEKINLTEEKWDYLIILDACRYDYFRDIYGNYFGKGIVRKAVSPATTTIEWLAKTFPDYYEDMIYISSSPFVKSRTSVEDWGI
ncbi:MAG: hypothetical protein ABEK36_04755 [Candidatus Aenigmatarchaeota archaeon]